MRHLTFLDLRVANMLRCDQVFHPIEEWSENDWMTAIAGEVGEAANMLKKRRRGEDIPVAEVMKELADAVIYIDLLCERLDQDLGNAVIDKFNEVSRRTKSTVFLS
jgi:NTP pyrophosphatase (non-canonical NTP hydrolase)